MSAPDPRVVRQLRHDVDDVFLLVDATKETVTGIASTQRRHSARLEEIQQTLDLQAGQLQRIDDLQRAVGAQGVRLEEQGGRLDGLDRRLDEQGGLLAEQGGRLGRMEEVQLRILEMLRPGPPSGAGRPGAAAE